MQNKKDARWAECTLIVAAKRHGKSTLAEQIVRVHRYKNALIYKLGVNLYDEAFRKYKVCKDIYSYKGGKVIVDGSNIEYSDFLKLVFDNFRNGILLIDDASSFESDTLSLELKRILVDSRKLGIEVLLLFHAISDVPIKLFPYMNSIVLGHTTDNPAYKLRKLPNGNEVMAAKEKIAVQAAKGNRFFRERIILS